MKKITLLMSFLMLLSWQGYAQQPAGNYGFSETTEVYTAVVGTNSTATGDDGSQNTITLPFTFKFEGVTYTNFSINTNGFIRLGNTIAGSPWSNLLSNTAVQRPLIAPFWDDNNRGTGAIQYAVSGVSPNQIFEIGWDNVNIGGGGSTSTTMFASYKIRLYETTDVIEFIYGPTMAAAGTLTASVGINGTATFLSVTPNLISTTSNATANNTISATTDLVGKKFIFTPPAPPACPAPSALTASNVLATSADLAWTENGTATLWDIEYGATPFTPTGTPTITGTTTNPHNLTGLTAQTTYAYYVRADCGASQSSWVGPFTFTTACTVITPPYTQPFATFLPDACWNEADGGTFFTGPTALGASPWVNGTAIGNTARINLYTTTRSDWVLTPYFDLSLGGYEVVIDVAVTNWNSAAADAMGADDSVRVVYTEDNITWNNLITFTAANNLPNSLTTFSTLIPSTANNVRFGILATDGPIDNAEDYDFHIDNFIVRIPPTCPAPSALTATNITATSADLNWTENGTATLWDIEYGATPFTPTGTPTVSGITVRPHNLTGLTAQTTYEYYVRADCGATQSAWVGPFTFTTACTAVVAPWNENFENAGVIPACWNQGVANAEAWRFSNTGSGNHLGNNGTMNGTTTSGNYFAWVDDSSPHSLNTTLESPLVNVSALTSPELSFYLISNNEGNTNVDFSVDVWDGAAWNVGFYTHNTNTIAGEWEKIVVNLSTLTITGNIQFRFIVNENNGTDFYDDVAIDDVDVHEAPACPAPSALTATNILATSADLAWTENGTATLWDIEYGATPFTPTGTPTVSGITVRPHNLTGLTAQTTYQYYVRADCGATQSTWVGPYTFTTACASYVAPYLEQFNVASLPACWSQSGATTWEYGSSASTPTGFAAYGAANVPDHSTPAIGTFIGMDGSDNTDGEVSVLLSPFIDASPLTTPHLSYWVFSNNIDDAAQNKLIVELWDGTSWNFIDSIQANLGSNWVNFDTVLTSLSITGDVQVRFTITGVANGGSTFYNDILIDDVQIYEPLANDVGVISITSTPAGCGLGMETVTVKVKNYGSNSQVGFDVIYSLNGTPVTPETVVGTVLPGDTLTHVFTTLANMSTPNNYTINAWSLLTTDGNNANDTLNGWTTEHIASSLTYTGNDTIHNLLPNGSNTIVCTNGLVNNMLDTCYRLSALVIDSLMHTFNGDLDIWLISPAGDTLEISTDNGGSTDNYINVTFTDTATTNINGNNPAPGFYHTEELIGLYKFNGTNPEGAWTLKVVDDAGGDNGTLFKWHLEFTDYNFVVDLGADSTACPDDTLTFNAGAGNYSYSWSTGATTQQISVDTNSLGGNGTYNISVVVTDTISGCQSTDTVVVTYSVCAGVNGLANNVNMNVYPNPNNGEFTLNINTTDINSLDVKVMNTQGQVVYAKNNYTNITNVNDKIDLSDNANGIYFIVITTEKGVVTHKLVIQ